MPYILAQGYISSQAGHPMIRPLFFEFPGDPNCWYIEDEYLFGEHLLIAPIFRDGENSRNVYLPDGCLWLDYHSRREYAGGKWHSLQTNYHIIVLVKDGSIIPVADTIREHIGENQDACKLKVYCHEAQTISGTVLRKDSAEFITFSHNGDNKPYYLSPDGKELLS
jgi:alpha-D-xyloside xylohydrolase